MILQFICAHLKQPVGEEETSHPSFAKEAGGPSLFLTYVGLILVHPPRNLRIKNASGADEANPQWLFLLSMNTNTGTLFLDCPKVIAHLWMTMFPPGAPSFLSTAF